MLTHGRVSRTTMSDLSSSSHAQNDAEQKAKEEEPEFLRDARWREDRPAPGFTVYAERLNGRAAMLGFVATVLIELAGGRGIVPLAQQLLGGGGFGGAS
ncbi:unnamed protein product [Agarophyton chilense]